MAAPEPSDVLWHNLELSSTERRRRLLKTYSVFTVLIAVNTTFILGVKALQNMDDIGWDAATQTWMSLLFAVSTFVTNLALKLTNRALTSTEGHRTSREEELSTFNKLAVAYLLNSVLIPLVVYAFPLFVSQAWYEAGGAVESAVMLMLTDAVGGAGRCIQFPILMKRYVLAPLTARSQRKVDNLWEPPPMFIGELYAQARPGRTRLLSRSVLFKSTPSILIPSRSSQSQFVRFDPNPSASIPPLRLNPIPSASIPSRPF